MRVLLVTAGSFGDVLPFLGIGTQLKKYGHNVTLITSEYFRSKAETEGLSFQGFSTVQAYEKTLENESIFSKRESAKIFAQDILLPAIEPVYEYIKNEYMKNSVKPSPEGLVVLATGFCFGARIACEKFSIPLATIKLSPVQFRTRDHRPDHYLFHPILPQWFIDSVWYVYDRYVTDPLIAPTINQFRSNIGLKPVKRILDQWWNSPQKIFGLFPEWILPPGQYWPSNADLTGFALSPVSKEPLPVELESFLLTHPGAMVFTPGTAISSAQSFFKEALKIIQKLKRPGIFLTRFNQCLPEKLPDNCIHVNYIPLSVLLPRVSLLVHPGGIGTIAESIRAKVPQLVVPAVNDQFDNASRIERLGLGCRVHQRHFIAGKVIGKIQYLLNSQSISNLLNIRGQSLQHNNLEEVGKHIQAFIEGYDRHSHNAGDGEQAIGYTYDQLISKLKNNAE